VVNPSNNDPVGSLPQMVGSNLPDAFKHRFFQKPESWSDKKLSAWILRNPILDLCLRLATIDVGPNGKGCFDPKWSREPLKGSRRLHSMIGGKVPSGTFKRMLCASSRQWKFVEECWIANMHTVLLNQYFDPVKRDRHLFKSIKQYKIWFVRFAFEGTRRVKRHRDGHRFRVFIPSNFERLLQGLKKIAGILQWVALSDMKEYNAAPPTIPYWKGYHSETQSLELVWFSGHLLTWRSCLTPREFDERELANLCQIRTFGRALPCPTREMCRSAFEEQMEILTNEYETPQDVLRTVERFAQRIGQKLGIREMPLSTHISVSTSGCFERSQNDGGIAGEISEWISMLDIPMSEVRVVPHGIPGCFPVTLTEFISEFPQIIDIRDVYGEMLFPRPKSFYGFSQTLKSVGLKKKELTFLQVLYGGAGLSAKRRKVSKLIGEESLPSEIGKACLLMASSFALDQGEFLSDINAERVTFDHYLKVGDRMIPIVSGPVMRYHLIYRPISMPKAELNCLAEPGAKTRPLGKNQAWFTLVTRAMRFMAEPIIARDGRARIGLRSTNKMWSFLKYLGKVGPGFQDPIGQSTDYKSATDLIPLDVLKAIWVGFLRGLPDRHPFWVYGTLITCQRAIYKAKPFKGLSKYPDGILNRRGSFMGEPMSFLTLTLENLLVEEISDYFYCNPGVPLWDISNLGVTFGRNPCCICGDDVAALRESLRRILLFRKVAIAMGWQFSWKEGISRRILIFCEDHALLSGKGDDFRAVYIDVVKSRLLTTMSREHSDNRSSILGKGRMLSNQLDYFEDKNLKIAILGYYRNIFDRCFDYNIIRNQACKMPIYLPPCAGGMGIPIVDTLIPEFMWPYIGYIYEILSIEDWTERFCRLEELSSLNHRVKHGFSSDTAPVLKQVLASFSRAVPSEDSLYKGDAIYEDSHIMGLFAQLGIECPSDPYTKKWDFSSLRNEAARLGFVPLSSLPEEVERVLNFQAFLKGGAQREPRTFNKWLKTSRRYWRKAFSGRDSGKLSKLGKSEFKSIALLEKAITRSFNGWVYVGDDLEHMSLINSGPSMKVHFTSTSKLGGRLRLYPKSYAVEAAS